MNITRRMVQPTTQEGGKTKCNCSTRKANPLLYLTGIEYNHTKLPQEGKTAAWVSVCSQDLSKEWIMCRWSISSWRCCGKKMARIINPSCKNAAIRSWRRVRLKKFLSPGEYGGGGSSSAPCSSPSLTVTTTTSRWSPAPLYRWWCDSKPCSKPSESPVGLLLLLLLPPPGTWWWRGGRDATGLRLS